MKRKPVSLEALEWSTKTPVILRDARRSAATLLADLEQVAPHLSVFAFGTQDRVQILIGTRAALSIRGRVCVHEVAGVVEQVWVADDPWSAIARFLDESRESFVGGHLGFDLHTAALGEALSAPYAATRLFVPEWVLSVRPHEIEAFTASGHSLPLSGVLKSAHVLQAPAFLRTEAIPLSLLDQNDSERTRFLSKASAVLQWIDSRPDRRCTIARQVTIPQAVNLEHTFAASSDTSPESRSFYSSHGEFRFAGTSPELLLDGHLRRFRSYKLSGTYPRLPDPSEDAALARDFERDEKIRAEHELSVTGMQQSLRRVGTPTRVHTNVLNLPRLRHMLTVLDTQCPPDLGAADILSAVLPLGAMPAAEGLRLILELEGGARGAYYGLVGLIQPNGHMEFSQLLRAILQYENHCFTWVGAAIMSGSTPESEFDETRVKLNSIEAARAHFSYSRESHLRTSQSQPQGASY